MKPKSTWGRGRQLHSCTICENLNFAHVFYITGTVFLYEEFDGLYINGFLNFHYKLWFFLFGIEAHWKCLGLAKISSKHFWKDNFLAHKCCSIDSLQDDVFQTLPLKAMRISETHICEIEKFSNLGPAKLKLLVLLHAMITIERSWSAIYNKMLQ